MIQGAGALRERVLKITSMGDKIVAILAFCSVKGCLPALREGVEGFILQRGSEMSFLAG